MVVVLYDIRSGLKAARPEPRPSQARERSVSATGEECQRKAVVRGLGRAFLYLYYHVTGFSPLCCCERGGFYPLGVFGGEGLKTANCEFRCKIPEGQPFTRISL